MKKMIWLTGLFLIITTVDIFAQGEKDYSILLNSGKFIPAENTSSLNRNTDLFQKSLFGEKNYVTIQFWDLPDDAMKERLRLAGIELIDYIPNYAFTAAISADLNVSIIQSFPIRSVFRFTSVQKTIPAVLNGEIPVHAIKSIYWVDVEVLTYEKINASEINGSLNAFGAGILGENPVFRTFTIRVPRIALRDLVDLPFVQWVEFIGGPNQTENLLGRTLHRVNTLNDGPRNLKGDGVNVGIWDSGEISPHLDFSPVGRVTQVEFNSPQQHSTHCSGTILGRGLINPLARGMAPNANLYSYNYNGDVQSEMTTAIPLYNLAVSSHSYNDGGSISCSLNGIQIAYTLRSRNTDINLNNFPFHLHCHSAGNSQTSCANGWFTITGTGKSAKNNIVVAALTSTDVIAGFSSFGPVADGRIKPEISAFGSGVLSTSTPLNAYATLSGTSMSTPGVAGTVTLLVQRYKQLNANVVPPSSLIKNIICNTALDLGNPGPDYKFGFGRINALDAVKILEAPRYTVGTISNAGVVSSNIIVPAGAARLRVMLTWNDPAGATNANPALVNNLDLTLVNGPTTTLPWILDKNTPAANATRAVDNISNIEQVQIDNPAAGTYNINITGTSIPMGPQEYSVTWVIDMPNIEVIYPNGAESFDPNSSQMITWNNAGIAGNQTVEYSLDNGSNWNAIGTASATATRLAWTVPTANTSQALVRITSGAISDVSDANFKILGTVLGFSGSSATCNAGEVNFSWLAPASATHYDIYKLDALTGQFVILSTDITALSYTATGLTPGASMWFTIIAKNNSTNATSERANAINVTVSSGGGGMGSIGNITGANAICGATTGVPYSVASVTGATSYVWTAPPGAVISGGQGSNFILIDYPGGSTSGNVTTYATNGSCNTATVVLPVTVNSTAVNAPASGGDQIVTVCPPNTPPTLTATANVPPGHTVVWYSAPTGGIVVSNPTHNSIGTVTYYAASRNTTTNCESATRTPVTLTINSAPPSTITPSGTTTFCQGGSVTLTASSGSSYLWSNGATTQSIVVNTNGTFTVNVTNGSCIISSAPTTVTVNAIPSATISANGPLNFCDGNSVVLTASAGSAWLWSTGATTQSITVSISGTYTVRVTNSSGCFDNSAATLVAVSPNPVVSISAAPYTRLFPGLLTTLTANVSPPGTYAYAWYKNGNLIPGATSNSIPGISLSDLGSYTVTVTNTSGLPCSNTSAPVVLSDSATTKLFIYPSPNSGKFNVAYYTPSTNAKNTLAIYDSKGARVFVRTYAMISPYQLMDVDFRFVARGIYRVVLLDGSTGKKKAVGSVVIQ